MNEKQTTLKELVLKMTNQEKSKWIMEHVDTYSLIFQIVYDLSNDEVEHEISLFK